MLCPTFPATPTAFLPDHGLGMRVKSVVGLTLRGSRGPSDSPDSKLIHGAGDAAAFHWSRLYRNEYVI
jgi:hypothetical protein